MLGISPKEMGVLFVYGKTSVAGESFGEIGAREISPGLEQEFWNFGDSGIASGTLQYHRLSVCIGSQSSGF